MNQFFLSGEIFTSDINEGITDINAYNDVYDVPLEDFKDDIVELIILLNKMDFNRLDAIQLSYIYEKIIPLEDRRKLGQYYTPKSIIESDLQIDNSKAQCYCVRPCVWFRWILGWRISTINGIKTRSFPKFFAYHPFKTNIW